MRAPIRSLVVEQQPRDGSSRCSEIALRLVHDQPLGGDQRAFLSQRAARKIGKAFLAVVIETVRNDSHRRIGVEEPGYLACSLLGLGSGSRRPATLCRW